MKQILICLVTVCDPGPWVVTSILSDCKNAVKCLNKITIKNRCKPPKFP